MIHLFVYAVDGERVYSIQSPSPKEVIAFYDKYAHEGCDEQIEVDDKELTHDEFEKWYTENKGEK